MTRKLILSSPLLEITISRLCQELIENQIKDVETVILGLQPRGIYFAERIAKELGKQLNQTFQVGKLDATFFRDDYRRRDTIAPNSTDISFLIENKRVILVDDVLATGRMVRAALDAMNSFGRPTKVELCVLIDRIYNRDLPINADYVGKAVNTLPTEKVLVEWQEQGHEADKIWLITQ
ncbi:bifunctional pyr operon transcriptional regulator/uracil phosphoribosyltransferase PyrR [Aquirufa sp. OSTEICH-129V]|jgi:pyrimidine operon attenuation protein/uracil phosphoribosyltransferase|uniref:Bifunctional pyr operon transcriptional regulator/uracil phosphoribosyltransferase PyrR n=1 Tax=Aquirufa avitistagni TaxID=3104728 RepID=A0ABW6D9F9_9BACT